MHRCNAHRAESPDSARGRSRLPSWRILTVPVCAGLVGTTAIIVACSEQGPTALRETAPRISSDFLAVSALQSVAPDGRFILKHSVLSPNIPEIDEDQARQLATAFVGHFAHFLVHALEKDRGGTISLSALTPCKRAFYAAGAYEALSPTTPAVIRKATGPQWIVPFCAGGTPELAVYVSAYATDAVASSDLKSVPSVGEANFSIQGIPVGKQIPADPEDIAKLVSRLTGRKVAAVPELVMRPVPTGPALAAWSVTLDSPAKVKSTKKNWTTDAVFVGYFTDWQNQLLAADVDIMPTAPQNIEFDPGPRSTENKATIKVALRNAAISQLTLVEPEAK